MSSRSSVSRVVAGVVLVLCAAGAGAREPWIITEPTVVSTPMSVGDVIVLGGGSLIVTGVPYPMGARSAGP